MWARTDEYKCMICWSDCYHMKANTLSIAGYCYQTDCRTGRECALQFHYVYFYWARNGLLINRLFDCLHVFDELFCLFLSSHLLSFQRLLYNQILNGLIYNGYEGSGFVNGIFQHINILHNLTTVFPSTSSFSFIDCASITYDTQG